MADPSETPEATPAIKDNVVLRFRTVNSNVMGRVVRLGPALNTILSRHNYPPKVAEALGQALALVAMLGATLKNEGAILTLQAKTDGAISLLVADYEASGALRGYATFSDKVEEDDQTPVIGNGSLAMTIDPGPGFDRYQGIVALDGQSITDAAHTYFQQSEQLPTFVRLAVAQHYDSDGDPSSDGWTWRAGGLMIQHLSREGGTVEDIEAGDVGEDIGADEEPLPVGEDNEDWQRARHLAFTVEDHELLDPNLASDRLLFRLFHEEGVMAFPEIAVRDECRCSRERVENLLRTIGEDQLKDMTDEKGDVSVTCEFCTTVYRFAPSEFASPTEDRE